MKRLKLVTQKPRPAESISLEVKLTYIQQFIGITIPLIQDKDQTENS